MQLQGKISVGNNVSLGYDFIVAECDTKSHFIILKIPVDGGKANYNITIPVGH